MSAPWYDEAFGALYLELYAHRDQAEAARAMAWLGSQVRLAGRRVVDLGCGAGRHLRSLAASGVRALGIDRSPALLRAAAPVAPLVRADLRALPLGDASVDGAISMFTSLGYFERPAANAAVLREAARVVRADGFLLVDYLNAPAVRARLAPHSARRRGRYRIEERRWIEPGGAADRPDRVVKAVMVRERGAGTGPAVASYRESVALWDRPALEALLRAAGFDMLAAAGGYDGRPYDPLDAPRLLLLATRCRRT